MQVKRHISLSIKGAFRNYGTDSMAGLLSEDGRELSDREVRDYLSECLAKGWVSIPCGDCEGFDHMGGGCPGHAKCEHCDIDISGDNINRVCAYQVDTDTPVPDYSNATFCTCCDACREKCHLQLIEENHQ